MNLSSRLSELHPSGIRAVMALAAARKKSGMPVIHMEVGQPDFKTPQHIIDEAFKASTTTISSVNNNLADFDKNIQNLNGIYGGMLNAMRQNN